MTVYLVTDGVNSGANADLYGVFSSRTRAQAWIDRQRMLKYPWWDGLTANRIAVYSNPEGILIRFLQALYLPSDRNQGKLPALGLTNGPQIVLAPHIDVHKPKAAETPAPDEQAAEDPPEEASDTL